MNGYEIERKFLIAFPDTELLNIISSAEIVQTYLTEGENGKQRRVRRIDKNGEISYTYTEKLFITAVIREENERSIDAQEYQLLLAQARKDCVPIRKTRYCAEYAGQVFEIDVYPFSDKLAIMELELESHGQKIDFPNSIKLIREVTGDDRYSNASLANAGEFPV